MNLNSIQILITSRLFESAKKSFIDVSSKSKIFNFPRANSNDIAHTYTNVDNILLIEYIKNVVNTM